MENATHLLRDGYFFVEQAEEIVRAALGENRAMNPQEMARVAELREKGEPLIAKAKDILQAHQMMR